MTAAPLPASPKGPGGGGRGASGVGGEEAGAEVTKRGGAGHAGSCSPGGGLAPGGQWARGSALPAGGGAANGSGACAAGGRDLARAVLTRAAAGGEDRLRRRRRRGGGNRSPVTMKGLYVQRASSEDEVKFVYQERKNIPVASDNYVTLQVKACALSWINAELLSEINPEEDFFPVGREIAGIVLEVGNKVSFFQPNDEVVGILPMDSEESGLCEVIRVHEHYLVHKPEKVTWVEAAGTIRDGVRAYTALHYLSHISPGKSVLIMDGASVSIRNTSLKPP
uniref:Enoyl reductase (ER) domain-containing protein n=1 Tax=Ornithorhynchus anatinus TaxID=9258 RepID=A0A6I8N5N6_ORNAN